ncbi:MAG: ATP-dependent helicase Lhr and Lhr-like helicase [Actinomycetota bacterium]|nr:ATP-dependent helicase Lhr and Lhr-like helicase [Actinomycetota bacterium]
MTGGRDLLISAGTASGKSEAAWLPMCSILARRREEDALARGVGAMVISPLKALINDQYGRLSELCERLELPVHRWHGDVASCRKSSLLRRPTGVLLITPESLESLFINHSDGIAGLLRALSWIVIDELHSFVGSARGAQLQSLLHRVEVLLGRRVPRVALSATLGDVASAARFLRPQDAQSVAIVSGTDGTDEIRLQVRGYVVPTPPVTAPAEPDDAARRTGSGGTGQDSVPSEIAQIADHLFRTLRERDNLVFANSRAAVETYAELLARRSREERIRTEFLAHHGSLAKDLREHVEARLRDSSTPVTAVCTSTLELGIDVGSVQAIAQIGSPLTVSSLRQRLGRSGRRPGTPAVLRVYVTEPQASDDVPPPDALRGELFQTVAMVELLLSAWYEPPHTAGLHLSTLIQQVLSVLAQRGGARAGELFDLLCGDGGFAGIGPSVFAQLLRDLGRHDLVRQEADGLLLPGARGEAHLNHYSFYAAFQTSQDHRLVAQGRTLGTMPVERPLAPGTLLVFGGRRWRVLAVDVEHRVIELVPSEGGGQPPSFPGNGSETADEVRRTMRSLYLSPEVPRYLDPVARDLLREGREVFHRFGHSRQQVFGWHEDALLFPWAGDRVMNTLLVVLARHGLSAGQDGLCLTVRGVSPLALWELIRDLAVSPQPDPVELATGVRVRARDKYDCYLGQELLSLAYAARALDVPGTWEVLSQVASLPPPAPQLLPRAW